MEETQPQPPAPQDPSPSETSTRIPPGDAEKAEAEAQKEAERRAAEHRYKMCTSKKAYDTYEAAEFFGQADLLRPYKCQYCPKYHLTSKNVVTNPRARGKRKAR